MRSFHACTQVPALPRCSLVEIVPVLAAAPCGASGELDPSLLQTEKTTFPVDSSPIETSTIESTSIDSSIDPRDAGCAHKGVISCQTLSSTHCKGAEPNGSLQLHSIHCRWSNIVTAADSTSVPFHTARDLRDCLGGLISRCSDALTRAAVRWSEVSILNLHYSNDLFDGALSQASIHDVACNILSQHVDQAAAGGRRKLPLCCVPVLRILSPSDPHIKCHVQLHVVALT
jgi:hypothetical protein